MDMNLAIVSPPGNPISDKLQPGRMVEKFPRQFEFLGKPGSECLHAKCLGRVVPAVKNVHSQFFCQRKGPMRSFTSDKGIDAFRRGCLQIATRTAGDDADAFADFFTAWYYFRFCAG